MNYQPALRNIGQRYQELVVDYNMVCGSRTCKPNSVRNRDAAGRPFLWAGHRCTALATYPKV